VSAHTVCVFCGSSSGGDPAYGQAAAKLGSAVAERGWALVYGGAGLGLMGTVADAALEAGGRVVGVLPERLFRRERAHPGLSERKAAMARRADAFVALPGGMGTLEELFEILTWSQLGIHGKPVALLNVEGYFDALLAFLDHQVAEGFLRAPDRGRLQVAEGVEELLGLLQDGPSLESDAGFGLDEA
jgi:uncharacterized protein (TIGR00730 family)